MANVQTEQTVKTTIDGATMKELKNIVKKHKTVKTENALNFLKIQFVGADRLKVGYYNLENDIEVEKTFNTIYNENSSDQTFLFPIDTIKGLKGIKKDSAYSFIIADNGKIKFNNNGIELNVSTMDNEQYPKSPNYKSFESIGKLKYNDLMKLKQAVTSTSKTGMRPVLSTVQYKDGNIVSTDSHRLYKAEFENVNTNHDLLFRNAFIEVVVNNENKKDFSALLNENDMYIQIETINATYTVKKFEGNYPDTNRIIPTDFQQSFTILDGKHLYNALKAIKEVSKQDRNNVMKLEIVNDYSIKLSAGNNNDTVEVVVDIQKDYFENEFSLSFSTKFLMEAIEQLNKPQQLKMSFSGNMRPFIVNEPNNENEKCLVLPVRTY